MPTGSVRASGSIASFNVSLGASGEIDSARMATQASTRQRLDPEIFRLPVERIREGYYSDAYFVYTKQLLEEECHQPRVTMQVFQKHDSVLGGIDEAIAVLKTCSGHAKDGAWVSGWDGLDVRALHEGDR